MSELESATSVPADVSESDSTAVAAEEAGSAPDPTTTTTSSSSKPAPKLGHMAKPRSQFELSLQAKEAKDVEDVREMGLEDIWRNREFTSMLKTYASKKYAEENIMFLEEVLRMKEANAPEKIMGIYREYVEPSSLMEVNINDKTRKVIVDQIAAETYDISVFDAALDELVILIRESILTDFLTEYHDKLSALAKPIVSKRKRVVVVGGGFLGLTVARLLDEMPRFEVILIDTKEYFEYTPSMIYTLVDPTVSSTWICHYSKVVKNGSVVINPVQSVAKDHVIAGGQKIPYHYLVLSTGSSYTTQLKGENVTTSYRAKKLAQEYRSLEAAKTVLVIGGGPVGVETSTMVADKFPDKKVVLVDANGTLLKRTPLKAQNMALEQCRRFGIEVILGERVTSYNTITGEMETSGGRKISFDKAIVATGPVPNTGFLVSQFSDSINAKRELMVNDRMQLKGHTNVFSGGDCADFPVEKLAFNSAVHGVTIARNICRLEKGKEAAQAGTKGLATARKVQYAHMISAGPRQLITIFRNNYTILSTTLSSYKIYLSQRTQGMLVGTHPMWGYFGQLPKKLEEAKD